MDQEAGTHSQSQELGAPEFVRLGKKFEVLILSEAGKPIYSYTKREDAVTLMPLCSALIDYARRTQKETLQSIKTSSNITINFAIRSPLIIVVVHETHAFVDPQMLVEQLEAQVISILSAKILKSVFEERPTFDLKRSLYGSEKLLDAVTNLCAFGPELKWPLVQAFLAVSATNLGFSTNNGSLPTLPPRPHRVLVPLVMMPYNSRENIVAMINNVIVSNSKNMVFSLLFKVSSAENHDDDNTSEDRSVTSSTTSEIDDSRSNLTAFKIIAVCNHHDRHKLKIADIHIILALLTSSRAQLASVESLWMPICLPRFNQDAFLHSYISYTNGMKNCLVIMSVDRDEFSSCQSARNLIEEKLEFMYKESSQKNKLKYQVSSLVHPTLVELQEKLVSDSLTGDQLAEVQQHAQIYNSKVELYHVRQLQFLWYQTNKQVLWWQRSSRKSLNPVLYYVTSKMLQASLKHLWIKLADDTVFLGWHVPAFQLYAQFDCTITTNEATEVVQKITSWIKKEEDNFTLRDYK